MATAEDQIAALVDVYKATELKVLGRVSDSLSSGQDAPDWEVQKLLELERVKRLVTGDTTSAAVAGGSVARMLNDAFGSGRETDKIPAARQLKSDLIYAKVSTKVTQNAGLQQLVQQATTAAKPNTQLILRQVDDVYRQAVQRAGGGLLLGADTRKQAVQQVLNDFASQGVTGFVDKAGRKWSLPTYANMAVGTAMHRANIEGHLDKLREMGENLVVVSDHAGECPLCRPWEGKVLAIEHDGEHPTIDQARGAGLEHPGCRHRYGLWMEGISQPPIPQGSPEEYALKQRQNEIQRHVDEWQRRAAVGDPAAADKLKYWKSQLKAQKSLVSDAAAQSRETFNNLQATRTAATKAAADKAAQAAKTAFVARDISDFDKDWPEIAISGKASRLDSVSSVDRLMAENLSGTEREAIGKYASGEYFFNIKNAYLSGESYVLSDGSDLADVLQSVMAKTTLTTDTKLFRAMQVDSSWIESLSEGSIIENKFFSSTTTDHAQAIAYGVKKAKGQKPVILQILAPAGTHVSPGLTTIQEVILPPGARMRVRSVTTLSKQTLITVDLVDAKAAKAAATATARTTATVAKKVTTDAGRMSTGPVGSGLTNAEMKKLKAFHIEDMDDYMREGTNPNLGSGPGYMANCSNCVTAYELRSRGVWATALPRDRGRYRWETAKAWLAPDGNPPVILDVENAGAATMTAVEQALADMPDGARGAISCKWKTGGGHIWNWVKENGTVRFVDTQAYVRTENYLADSRGAIHIMRLDDAEFVGNVSDWVEPQ